MVHLGRPASAPSLGHLHTSPVSPCCASPCPALRLAGALPTPHPVSSPATPFPHPAARPTRLFQPSHPGPSPTGTSPSRAHLLSPSLRAHHHCPTQWYHLTPRWPGGVRQSYAASSPQPSSWHRGCSRGRPSVHPCPGTRDLLEACSAWMEHSS